MFIDSHAHLSYEKFDADREEVIGRAIEKGVDRIMAIGTDIESSVNSLEIANKYNGIFSTAGIHPHDAETYNDCVKKRLLKLLSEEKVVAVGEIGLDYYRDNTQKSIQKDVFAEQLRIAREVNKPVVIHVRDAWNDVEDVIERTTNGAVKGVFHCYSGDLETAHRLIKKGFFISFGGNITFKNFKNVDLLEQINFEKVLIETDSPFLTPEPFRGKRNEPGNVPLIASKLADAKNLTVEDIARITAFNANRLFGIAPEMERVKIVYEIRDSLYINPTLRCTADCVFCARLIDPVVKGHNLGLPEEDEPTVDEALSLIGDPARYSEIVFCGYGEPTLRLDFIKDVSRWLKSKGMTVRLNTNGHANMIHGRDVVPELVGLIDTVSISLNAHDPAKYIKIMRDDFGERSFEGMIDFIKKCVAAGIITHLTVVDLPGIDVEASRKLAYGLGAEFRVRKYDEVG